MEEDNHEFDDDPTVVTEPITAPHHMTPEQQIIFEIGWNSCLTEAMELLKQAMDATGASSEEMQRTVAWFTKRLKI